MVLNISNLNKTYADKEILKEVSFFVEDREKVALVGINGSGKTTLLKCIIGEEEMDSGTITFSKDKKVAYLSQENVLESETSLSGGQKMRKKIEELLAKRPDILILDEPTNHLDISSISWLEKVLKHYDGAILMVSHDRYFLDKIVNKIIDIENGRVKTYRGNYSTYVEKKKELNKAYLRAYQNQQEKIAHQEEVIKKLKEFNREKSIKRARSREKALEKMEVLERPVEIKDDMSLNLSPAVISGNDVLSIRGLEKSWNDRNLFKNVNFEIKRGEHIALIGENGTGKTSLLKMIISKESENIKLGAGVNLAYYDQEHNILNMENTIFDEIRQAHKNLTDTKIRNVLAAFLFMGEEVYKKIKDLSGGEKARVIFAKLMLSSANFLILDEPTNHLDIKSKEILEEALKNYDGTILFVSHDRYFINKVATRILEIYNNGIDNYIGNYDYYLSKKSEIKNETKVEEERNKNKESESKLDWEKQKELASYKRSLENAITKAQKKIEELESKIKGFENQMNNPQIAFDTEKLMDIHTKGEIAKEELEKELEIWEEKTIELEELEKSGLN